jgi:hypothetical protein
MWNAVLDASEDEHLSDDSALKSNLGHWGRVNALWINNRKAQVVILIMYIICIVMLTFRTTTQMIEFVKAQPSIVERLIAHISSPTIADILFRIVQCEESIHGRGIVDWLCEEGLVPRLASLLSPHYSQDVHASVAEFLRSVIGFSSNANTNAFEADSTTSPTGANLGAPGKAAQENDRAPGFASIRVLRELAARETVSMLVGFMLDDDMSTSVSRRTSSLVNCISVLIDLIRKDNSDFSEQQILNYFRKQLTDAGRRETFGGGTSAEQADAGPSVVQLDNVLMVVTDRLAEFQALLRNPRSSVRFFSPLESRAPSFAKCQDLG